MSPVTLDDNCTKMNTVWVEALLSYSALIFNATALGMHMWYEGFSKWLPTYESISWCVFLAGRGVARYTSERRKKEWLQCLECSLCLSLSVCVQWIDPCCPFTVVPKSPIVLWVNSRSQTSGDRQLSCVSVWMLMCVCVRRWVYMFI